MARPQHCKASSLLGTSGPLNLLPVAWDPSNSNVGRGFAAVRTFLLEDSFSKIISGFLLSQLGSRGLFCLTWLKNVLETSVIQSGSR